MDMDDELSVLLNRIERILKRLTESTDEYDSQLYYECFFHLNKCTSLSPTNDDLRLFSKYKCEKLFADMFKYYSEKCDDLHYQDDIVSIDNISENPSLNERRISIFSYLLLIINQILFKLVHFNLEFINNDGLIGLFALIKNEMFFSLLSKHDLRVLSCLVNITTTPMRLKNLGMITKCLFL